MKIKEWMGLIEFSKEHYEISDEFIRKYQQKTGSIAEAPCADCNTIPLFFCYAECDRTRTTYGLQIEILCNSAEFPANIRQYHS